MLFPTGTPGRASDLALTTPHTIVIADCTVTELRKVFRLKFPNRQADLEQFLDTMVPGITIVPTPAAVDGVDVERVRDSKDWSIVRAAVAAHVDAVVTGDKDLLDAKLPSPSMLTPATFLRSLVSQ